jgi:putative serine protease PepD
VLTNTHVVTLDGGIADPVVQVTTSDGHLFSASVVGTDPIADLAVIKLKDATGLTPAEFGDSSKLNVGETAIAIGAPLGLNNTVTNGIVSALNRSISIASSAAPQTGDTSTPNSGSPFDFWQFDKGQGSSQSQSTTAAAKISLPVIQTDAAINPGNSGGALLDANAKVIGINVAIASAGQTSAASQSGSIGVGFAISANLAQRVAKEIIKNGKATHGLLGAGVRDVAPTSTSTVVGASIKEITSGGAADKAGLQSGDIVTSFNGSPITSSTDLTAQVRFLAAGSSTSLTYVRGGNASTANVTLGALK